MFNQALLARQAWRLLDSPDSLCAQVLKAKYYPNGSLIDTTFTGNASPGWKGVEYGLELLKQGLIWRIGNGKSVKIWRDPWLQREFSRRLITVKRNCRLKWVAELIREDGTWDTDKISQYFWSMDVEEILKIRLPYREVEDFISWSPDKYGRFSVRSAYHLAVRLASRDEGSSSSILGAKKSWDLIWKCDIPHKVKIFAWKVATNCLATMENKKKRNLEVNDTCAICDREREDIGHALCRCMHASNL